MKSISTLKEHLLAVVVYIVLSPGWAFSDQSYTCDDYLSRLGDHNQVAHFLDIHRQRVASQLGNELVEPHLAGQDRETQILEMLIHFKSPEFLVWFQKNGNGAKLFHGSSSASLMAFLPPNSHGLLPNRVLIQDLGIVPLSGWFDSMGDGHDDWAMNMVGMNVVGLGNFEKTHQYAHQSDYRGLREWQAEILSYEKSLEEGRYSGFKSYQIELYKRRLEVLNVIPTELNWILENPFPVIYGFKLKEKSLVWRPYHDGPHTIIADNLSPQELRLVLVPETFVSRVKDLMSSFSTSSSIEVKPIHEVKYPGLPRNSDQNIYEYLRHTAPMTEESFSEWINTLSTTPKEL